MPGQFIIVIWVHWTFNTKPWTSPCRKIHYTDVIMSDMASQITSLKIVYSTDHSDADQRKDQRSASLALVRGIHRWPVNSPLKVQATLKMLPFDDVITLKKLFCWSLLLFMSHDSTKQSPLFSQRRSCLLSLWWRYTSVMASQTNCNWNIYLTACSSKHQRNTKGSLSISLALFEGNPPFSAGFPSPKVTVMRKSFPCHDVVMRGINTVPSDTVLS